VVALIGAIRKRKKAKQFKKLKTLADEKKLYFTPASENTYRTVSQRMKKTRRTRS
jgi:hypothetical protein